MCSCPGGEGIHTAAQVADTHGGGVWITVCGTECLYLQGTTEGDQTVGRKIEGGWKKGRHRQRNDFNQQNELAPVKAPGLSVMGRNLFTDKDSCRKGQYRKQVTQESGCVAIQKVGTHQYDIAGLCIGEYLFSCKVGIGILQAAGECDQACDHQCFGHLSVFHNAMIILLFCCFVYTFRCVFSIIESSEVRINDS